MHHFHQDSKGLLLGHLKYLKDLYTITKIPRSWKYISLFNRVKQPVGGAQQWGNFDPDSSQSRCHIHWAGGTMYECICHGVTHPEFWNATILSPRICFPYFLYTPNAQVLQLFLLSFTCMLCLSWTRPLAQTLQPLWKTHALGKFCGCREISPEKHHSVRMVQNTLRPNHHLLIRSLLGDQDAIVFDGALHLFTRPT